MVKLCLEQCSETVDLFVRVVLHKVVNLTLLLVNNDLIFIKLCQSYQSTYSIRPLSTSLLGDGQSNSSIKCHWGVFVFSHMWITWTASNKKIRGCFMHYDKLLYAIITIQEGMNVWTKFYSNSFNSWDISLKTRQSTLLWYQMKSQGTAKSADFWTNLILMESVTVKQRLLLRQQPQAHSQRLKKNMHMEVFKEDE